MTTTVRTIFTINATDGCRDFVVFRRGPAGISIEAQSRDDEGESATAGPFTPEQLRAALDEVAPAGSYPRPRVARPESPDYADGGVTCALIEKEAERERDHFQEVASTFRAKFNEADARAEKAEKEREREFGESLAAIESLRAQLCDALDDQAKLIEERDEARDRLAEAAKEIREQGAAIAELAAESRPLTPDANARNVVDFLAAALANLADVDRDYLARILGKGAQ